MNLPTRWDIFCRVIDNHGDIGVSWRLAADLASRGNQVRLWVDDTSALPWMAPGAMQGQWPGIRVLGWDQASDAQVLRALEPSDVWIEAFGCELAPSFIRHRLAAAAPAPVWINLEYLSAEPYAERSHGLASPVMQGIARGQTKYFYYPGFTPASGGLLRERDLAARKAGFDRARWLERQGIRWQGERLVSLFCYEPAALPALLAHWQHGAEPTRLLVTPGRAAAAVQGALGTCGDGVTGVGALVIDMLPPLSQTDFDHLLWASDLNLVRGEDSVIRALWAGKPLIWQIYPQHDNAHHAKLQAFLDVLDAPASLRLAHQAWNGIDHDPLQDLATAAAGWKPWAAAVCEQLFRQRDLVTRLQEFVALKYQDAFGRAEER
ncbi:MAG TPA: elongation factor P maturation arginine rhamnosyltransferase EarP [Burkholderiaceae bacterium]|nr:elongation factor P maturation arginine rhamnosyltransferase EarP [Burkholderiaceae bacterium]